MPRYQVESIEMMEHKVIYLVDADNPQDAEAKCKSGDVSYESKEATETDEWRETLSVEEQ